MFGTTDSYSTQIVSNNLPHYFKVHSSDTTALHYQGELQHRRVKRFYARTNKHRSTRQIARLNERERALQALQADRGLDTRTRMQRRIHDLPIIPPEAHHFIAESRNDPVNLSNWLHTKASKADIALKDFRIKLKNHLLHRLREPGQAEDGTEYTPQDRSEVTIKNDRVYRQRTFRVNFTTYDVRRDQDSMNPRRRADIMMLSHDVDPTTGTSLSGHPFTYARILDIFQVPIIHMQPGSSPTTHTIPVLFVRRYELDTRYRTGFQQKRLPRVKFLPAADPAAFSFIDPDEVIRGAHLIPAFAHGRTTDYLQHGDSVARLDDHKDDWCFYYVNWYISQQLITVLKLF
ncbi:hypothetical protein K474DRAFT_1723253 [Panus rudis PR-1116 ss-1]|nr:hypothetical protein K474DRAFT_1723253 [Panus rudis PR-1116 ss-1]